MKNTVYIYGPEKKCISICKKCNISSYK